MVFLAFALVLTLAFDARAADAGDEAGADAGSQFDCSQPLYAQCASMPNGTKCTSCGGTACRCVTTASSACYANGVYTKQGDCEFVQPNSFCPAPTSLDRTSCNGKKPGDTCNGVAGHCQNATCVQDTGTAFQDTMVFQCVSDPLKDGGGSGCACDRAVSPKTSWIAFPVWMLLRRRKSNGRGATSDRAPNR